MVRPRKRRRINFNPRITFFKPRGVPMRELDLVVLEPDELEAFRLIDYEGLDQEGASEKMKVSRITVQRIYKRARKKIAKALIEGRAIELISSE